MKGEQGSSSRDLIGTGPRNAGWVIFDAVSRHAEPRELTMTAARVRSGSGGGAAAVEVLMTRSVKLVDETGWADADDLKRTTLSDVRLEPPHQEPMSVLKEA